ncbi:MAG: SDR family oxidoreductase [Bacillota bacterium]
MKKIYGEVVFITGASSGIGKAIAEYLAKEGYRVYGTTRNLEKLTEKPMEGIEMVQLDVCNDESIKQAVDYVYQKEGRIDILINNAGFILAGSIEDTTHEEAFMQFDTNFFGMHRVCRHVIPLMREKKNGLIINTSSVAGIFSIAYQSMYSASKYAVEAFTEALRMELAPFGVKVSMVEPGDTKTNFTSNRVRAKASADSVYKDIFNKSVSKMEKDEMNGPAPTAVVKAVAKIISSSNPPVRIVAGFTYKVLVFLKRILPSRAVLYILSKMYS